MSTVSDGQEAGWRNGKGNVAEGKDGSWRVCLGLHWI